jgi:hypothetical protein
MDAFSYAKFLSGSLPEPPAKKARRDVSMVGLG